MIQFEKGGRRHCSNLPPQELPFTLMRTLRPHGSAQSYQRMFSPISETVSGVATIGAILMTGVLA